MNIGGKIACAALCVLLCGGCTKELWEQPLKQKAETVQTETDRIVAAGIAEDGRVVLVGGKMSYVLNRHYSMQFEKILQTRWRGTFRLTDGSGSETVKVHIRNDSPQQFFAPIYLEYRYPTEEEGRILRSLSFVEYPKYPGRFGNSYGLQGDVYAAKPDMAAKDLSIPVEIRYERLKTGDTWEQIGEKMLLMPFAVLIDVLTLPSKLFGS